MNWKSIISIIALFAIGFMTGFFTNRYLTLKAAEQIAVLRKAKGMEQKLYKVLQLEAKQIEQLTPIIKSHFSNLISLNKEHQQKRTAIINELTEEISPALNEEQKMRLEKFSERLKRIPGKRRKMKKERPMGKKLKESLSNE